MNKKINIFIAVIAAAALCISVFCLVKTLTAPEAAAKDLQFVLYLGTNDKDTNEPVFAPEEAKEQLKNILISRFGGYTIQEAGGGWKDDDGTEFQEYTLVIYLSDTNADDVYSLCDELLTRFRQSSVLLPANETKTEFYAGKAQ